MNPTGTSPVVHQGEVIPHEYLDGLLSRDNVRDALTKQFFEGNYAQMRTPRRVFLSWENLWGFMRIYA